MAEAYRYTYVAKDTAGTVRTGTLVAENEIIAARRLRILGLTPLSLNGGPGVKNSKTLIPKRVKPKNLALFNRQLATMITAGLPITRALKAMADQSDHPELKKHAALVAGEVEAGMSMSKAMQEYPRVFPPLMTTITSAGEASGSLGSALARAASMYEKQARLRSKIFSAMFYPIIIMGVAVLLVVGMLLFIVPIFEGVFAQLNAELPLPTRILMAVSGFLKYLAIPVVIGGVVGFFWYRAHQQDPNVRKYIDPVKIRIPILGKFNRNIVLARWSRTLSSLIDTGVSLLEALDISANAAGNEVYARSIRRIREAVRAGQPLAAPMESDDLFPPMVDQMVATGEESGALAELLGKVADYYDDEVETRADTLTSVIEPLMLIFLGVVIGGITIALYLPMFSVYSNIK